jgi:hypothetical protein
MEILRSNPNAPARLRNGTAVFIPPCNGGVVQGTRKKSQQQGIAIPTDGY